MNEQTRNLFARGLTTVRSRRQALALLVGTGTLVGLGEAEARKGGKGKGKHKGKGKGRGKSQGQEKVLICHRNGKGFTLISVSSSAVPAHEGHGDVVCAADVCQAGAATGCDTDGACEFALAAEGTTCTSNGTAGACTAEGVCEPIP